MEKMFTVALCHCGKVVFSAEERLAQSDTVIISQLQGFTRDGLKIRKKDAQFVRENFTDHKLKNCPEKTNEKKPIDNQLNLF